MALTIIFGVLKKLCWFGAQARTTCLWKLSLEFNKWTY